MVGRVRLTVENEWKKRESHQIVPLLQNVTLFIQSARPLSANDSLTNIT